MIVESKWESCAKVEAMIINSPTIKLSSSLTFASILLLIFCDMGSAHEDSRGATTERLRAECFLSIAQGKYQSAILACGAAIELDSTEPELYSNRGSASLMMWLPENGISDFTMAIRLAPTDARNYFNRGIAFETIKSPSQAKTNYDMAISLQPDMANAYYNRGQLHRTTGRTPEAIPDYRKAAELDSQYELIVAAAIAMLGEL